MLEEGEEEDEGEECLGKGRKRQAGNNYSKTAAVSDTMAKRGRKVTVMARDEDGGEGTSSSSIREEEKGEEWALNKWELLPKTDAKWMRGLLEVPGASFLTVLPCIRNEKIMPTEVFNIINNGRGKIIFYANVVHSTLCPRFLVNGDAIHRHHNDSAVAICITQKISESSEETVNRLFVRCFSEKCLHLCRKVVIKEQQIISKWEEYSKSHYIKYMRLLIAEKRSDQPEKAT